MNFMRSLEDRTSHRKCQPIKCVCVCVSVRVCACLWMCVYKPNTAILLMFEGQNNFLYKRLHQCDILLKINLKIEHSLFPFLIAFTSFFPINLFLENSIPVKDDVTIIKKTQQLYSHLWFFKSWRDESRFKVLRSTTKCMLFSILHWFYSYAWPKKPFIFFSRVSAVVVKPPCVAVKLPGGDGCVMTTEASEIWCQHLSVPSELASPITILTLTWSIQHTHT